MKTSNDNVASAVKPPPLYRSHQAENGFTVYRDDQPLQTPRALPICVSVSALADAIVKECAGQGEKLDLRRMPMTQMTLTVIDIASQHRAEVINGIMRHGECELLCQRATAPVDLAAEQDAVWQPFLDWARAKWNIEFTLGKGVTPAPQPEKTLSALRAYVDMQDNYHLIGLSEAVGISGSLVLGLALACGRADAATICAAGELDVIWQNQKWGADPATQNRLQSIKHDLQDCQRWFELLRA